MKRTLIALALVATLGGCAATSGGLATTGTFAQKAEAKETQAEDIYLAVHDQVQALVPSTLTQAQATAIEVPVWDALQVIRTAYNAGLAVDLTVIQAKQAAAVAALPTASTTGGT